MKVVVEQVNEENGPAEILETPPQQDFKFVIIGGNEPVVNEYFIEAMKKYEDQIVVFELTYDEMKFIINSRATVKAEEIAVDYLNETKNKERIEAWVRLLMENHIRATVPKHIQEETLTALLGGEREVMFTRKTLKVVSKLSWKNFDELFANLEMFGVVRYVSDDKSEFTLIMDRKKIIENQGADIKELLNVSLGKLLSLNQNKDITSKEKAKVKSISTKLSAIIKSM